MRVKEAVLELAEKIKNNIELQEAGKEVIGTEKSDTVFADNLPDGITINTVEVIDEYKHNYVSAATLAFGELAIESMKKNNDIEKGSINIQMYTGADADIKITKEQIFRNPQSENDKVTVFGGVTGSINTYVGKNSGQMTAVREQLKALATAAFKK